MGVTVRQKVKGKGKPWWIFINHNGQRASKRIGDKKATEGVASEIRRKMKLGEFCLEDRKPSPTFKTYADSWIETTIPATCKETTVRDYKDILNNHVEPVLGNLRLTEITRGKIKDFYTWEGQ